MIRTIIADDEKVIRNGLKKLLEASELPLSISEPASNGTEAVELIKSSLPQIILMDINMPGIKGLQVIEAVKPYVPDAKIIIISGHDDFHYVQRALQLGAFDYLLKPINKSQLIDVIKKAVDTLMPTEKNISFTEPTKPDNGNSISAKAIEYIKDNYNDCELTLATLSKLFHVSESYMTRIIKQRINKSFSSFLTELRMNAAMNMLSTRNDLTVGQIAEMVGFSSHHYFCRVFKASTGLSPLEYKNKIKTTTFKR
ncbi:MAG: response regulator [Clostridium sp.]